MDLFRIKSHPTHYWSFFDNYANEAMNKNKVLLANFHDFSKAFGTVDHEILLRKLELYGFRGNSLQGLSSLL